MRTPLLIAGIGNIFLGDDGFGAAVVQRLQQRPLPAGVHAVDFGVRTFDLACALESCDAAILIDATQRGDKPGTLYVIEPRLPEKSAPMELTEGHTLVLDRVLRNLPANARPRLVRIVGCEPLTCEPDFPDEPSEANDLFTLSPPVRQAVDEAASIVESLALQIMNDPPYRELRHA